MESKDGAGESLDPLPLSATTSVCGSEAFIDTLAGGGGAGVAPPAVLAVQGRWSAHISRPSAMSFAEQGRSLVFRSGQAGQEQIYNLHIASGMITPICPAPNVVAVCFDDHGTLFMATTTHISCMAPEDGAVTQVAGGGASGTDATGGAAGFETIKDMTIDGHQNLLVLDGYRLRKVTRGEGVVTTIAGARGASGHVDGIAVAAKFKDPAGLAFDSRSGNIYIADTGNNRIRKITPDLRVSTVAGDGKAEHKDGRATAASLKNPGSITVEDDGWLYILDHGSHAIRCLSPTGDVTTIAGKPGTAGYVDSIGPDALVRLQYNQRPTQSLCSNGNGLFAFGNQGNGSTGSECIRSFRATSLAAADTCDEAPLIAQLGSIVDDEGAGDVTVVATDGDRIHSLKGLLRLRSEYFKTMLDSGLREGNAKTTMIKVEGSGAAVRAVVLYLHTETLTASDAALPEVLNLAEMWRLPRLKVVCGHELKRRITPANVCGLLISAEQLGASALRKQCIAYIVNHFSRVREQGEFKSLEKDLIMEVLLGLQM